MQNEGSSGEKLDIYICGSYQPGMMQQEVIEKTKGTEVISCCRNGQERAGILVACFFFR
jgi:hypothetical protein